MTTKCKKHGSGPREQPLDSTERCPACHTERLKVADGRATYTYPPGYERKRASGPLILRMTKDRPPGEAFVFCFEGQLHAQSEPIFDGFVICAAGPCACGGQPDKCPHRNPRLLHTIADHDHEKCMQTARQLVAQADSLPSVTHRADGSITIVERMLIGEELVPHARRALESKRSELLPKPRSTDAFSGLSVF